MTKNCDNLDARIGRVIDAIQKRFPSMLAVIVRDTRNLCRYGEYGVAFENMCQNLYEDYSEPVTISRLVYDELAGIAAAMRMDSNSYSFLESLVTEDPAIKFD